MTKKELKELVIAETFGMSDEQLSIITRILSKEINNLTGEVFATSSGGGCCHVFFQLKDFNWIGFHNTYSVEKPTITSKPFKTSKSLENAFFEQDDDIVTSEEFFKARVSKKEYEKALKVVKLYEAQRK